MGRKPLPPNMRAQPISFSLKPHLIAKINEYSEDLRFNRSKFLQQAVTEYMTRNIVNANDMDLSSNVHDMSIGQRVAVGLAALQEANRDGETIPKPIMDALRRELDQSDQMTEVVMTNEPVLTILKADTPDRSEYEVRIDLEVVGKIYKVGTGRLKWILEDVRGPKKDHFIIGMYGTLKAAKRDAMHDFQMELQ